MAKLNMCVWNTDWVIIYLLIRYHAQKSKCALDLYLSTRNVGVFIWIFCFQVKIVFVNASLKAAKIWSLIITATFSSGDIDFWHKLQSWLIAQLNITK